MLSLEKKISNAMAMEYRTGILTFNDVIITGHGIKIVKVHQGLVLNLGTSITDDALKNTDWDKSIISAGVMFGVM